MGRNIIHLPGLNGIRAMAALLVVFSHISLHVHVLGLEKQTGIDMAGIGVTMFFVLSGYLITYLLIKEKEKSGMISKRKFYVRRILRIWPVYYLALIISLIICVIQSIQLSSWSILLYTFLMANVPFVFGGMLPHIGQLWSVGVEEQFYLFWPWLFKSQKKLPWFMFAVIAVFILARIFLRIYENGVWYTFVGVTRFHCMAIGGLGAWAILNKKIPSWVYSKFLQIICWFIVGFSLYKPLHIASIIDGEIYAVIFLIIIINVSTNPKTIITLEQKYLHWLGKISYGIYVYHMFALALVFGIISRLSLSPTILKIAAFTFVPLVTILFAYISYHYFEKYFLKKKHLYSVVESSPSSRKIKY